MNDDDTVIMQPLQGVPDPDADITENGSVLGRLQSQHRAVAEDTTADFDIPGYNGELFVRYRTLDSQDLDDIRRRVRYETKNPGEQITAASLDTLIAACDEFWVRDDGKEIPLKDVEGVNSEFPVKYDHVLAEALGFTDSLPNPPTVRSIVIAVFGGNVLAAQAHSALVSQWMLRINVGVDQQLGGI